MRSAAGARGTGRGTARAALALIMRVRVLLSLLIFGASVTGCSGATDTELLDGPPSTANLPAATDSPGGSSTKEDESTSAPKPSGTAGEAPAVPGEEPQAPKPACESEIEGNDSELEPNTLSKCVRGKLGGGRDVDFFRVAAPENAKKMLLGHTRDGGRVAIRVTEEGAFIFGAVHDVDTDDDEPAEIDVKGGARYLVRVSGGGGGNNGGNSPSYELDVAFE